ncbi:uncharacterized protein LOC101681611 isoform X1 [Mustela putorius furo]|uniref:Uncharacterized protein LOC101681611 isoform X1 n=1 Tax=Mustela putorius furo TaxID=9669 RepID=A0A8U0MU65_MUSPF|nr:uncharacterized protein LOC101681611 isoform X1 [Mustela putorius furo]
MKKPLGAGRALCAAWDLVGMLLLAGAGGRVEGVGWGTWGTGPPCLLCQPALPATLTPHCLQPQGGSGEQHLSLGCRCSGALFVSWADTLYSVSQGSRTLDKVIRPVWLPLPPVQVEHQLALDLALLTSCSSCPDLSWGSAVRVWVQGLETWPRGPGRLHAGVTRVGTGAVPPASGSQGPGRRLLRLPTGAGWAARQEEWASHVPAKVAENQVCGVRALAHPRGDSAARASAFRGYWNSQ